MTGADPAASTATANEARAALFLHSETGSGSYGDGCVRIGRGPRRCSGWRSCTGSPSTSGGVQQFVELTVLGESVADEALVARVLEQPADQVRHARHELADRRVDPQPQTAALDGGLHRLGHAVQHLDLEPRVGDALRSCVRDRVGKRAQVVRAERGAHLAVVVVQQADASLEVGVGLGLVLVHRDRPSRRSGLHGLGVPVRALDQADRDRRAASG